MNQEASHLVTTRALPGVVQAEGFYRKKGGERKSLVKEKKGLFWARTTYFWREETQRVLSCRMRLLPLGWGVGVGWGEGQHAD